MPPHPPGASPCARRGGVHSVLGIDPACSDLPTSPPGRTPCMLRSASKIFGYRLNGADGEIGRAVDLLFDDRAWMVRYLVIETGAWLDGRRVLISPLALRKGEWTSRRLVLDGTRQ